MTSKYHIETISHKNLLFAISSKDLDTLSTSTLIFFPFMSESQMMNEKTKEECTIKVKLKFSDDKSQEIESIAVPEKV